MTKQHRTLALALASSVLGVACSGAPGSQTLSGETGGGPAPTSTGTPSKKGGVPKVADPTEPTDTSAAALLGGTLSPTADARTFTGLADYYVGPGGDDGASCTSSAPCRQIARAVAAAGSAGGHVHVADGDYDPFTIAHFQGSLSAPLILEATGTGAHVGAGSQTDSIFVDQSAYVTLSGLNASNAKRAAVRVSGSRYVRVQAGTFADNGKWGIFTDFSDDVTLERNEIYGSKVEHGIYLSNSGDRPVVRLNKVHDNNGSGIQINADLETKDDYGIYGGVADGLTTGAVLEYNVIYGNGAGGGSAFNFDGVQDSVVRNNVLYGNHATGIVMYGDADGEPGDGLGGGDGFDGDGAWGPSGMLVEYNTVVMASDGRAPIMIRYSHGATPNVVRNNIFGGVGSKTKGLEIGSGLGSRDDLALLRSDYNVLPHVLLGDADDQTLSAWQGSAAQDAHSIDVLADALAFVDPSSNDYRLKASSPAANRGIKADGSGDILGLARPKAVNPNLGAYEAE